MEGFCRLLWGLSPLLASGDDFEGSADLAEGLSNGTDPTHPEFWGFPSDLDQRLVDLAAVAFALVIAPDRLWKSMPARQRSNIVTLLGTVNDRKVRDNNWLLFRALVNVALARLDGPFSRSQIDQDLNRVESFYLGDGWYGDGPGHQCDYYSSFGFHFYGLLYAHLAADIDSRRASLYRQRAVWFSREFLHWFAADGTSLPYGRSLTYRFANVAFWGASAVVGLNSLSHGILKGLVLRSMRWWWKRPIFDKGGVLLVGYGYPNTMIGERYTSACSPYWALKAFLPLALADDHPFWTEPEAELPAVNTIEVQAHPRMILCRADDHVFALTGGQTPKPYVRHSEEKYAKFCYSTRFVFNIPTARRTLEATAHDSALALSLDGECFTTRHQIGKVQTSLEYIVCEWEPWRGVLVTTWLVPCGRWHIRVHRLVTDRAVISAEGGFAVGLGNDEAGCQEAAWTSDVTAALAASDHGVSVLAETLGARSATVVMSDPGSNLLHPRAAVPTLLGEHKAGRHWLGCAVVAVANRSELETIAETMPVVEQRNSQNPVVSGADYGSRVVILRDL